MSNTPDKLPEDPIRGQEASSTPIKRPADQKSFFQKGLGYFWPNGDLLTDGDKAIADVRRGGNGERRSRTFSSCNEFTFGIEK